jgi:hypothetical protein
MFQWNNVIRREFVSYVLGYRVVLSDDPEEARLIHRREW